MNKPKKVYMVWGIQHNGSIVIPSDLYYDFDRAKNVMETIWKVDNGQKYKWLDVREMEVR